MQIAPLSNWQIDMEKDLGFHYHSFASEEDWRAAPYWQAKAFYVFNENEVDEFEKAGKECYQLYCDTIEELVSKNELSRLGIDPRWTRHIKESWNKDEPSLIGRFDFSYDGKNLKLLEFNGDTPTSLFEASIVQWYSKEKHFDQKYDQFNFIHEQLSASWEDLYLNYDIKTCDFTSSPNYEDMTNAVYSMKIAQSKGVDCEFVAIDDLGYDRYNHVLYNETNRTTKNLYKLWPFEYLIEDDSEALENVLPNTRFIEPMWKMGMSTKAALALIHEKDPNSPYILKAYLDQEKANRELKGSYASKPFFSREGEGIKLIENGASICESYYADENKGTMYQELAKLPSFKDTRDNEVYNPVIGIWVIGGEVCGMGVRENKGLITDNNSLFVPHIFVKNEKEFSTLKAKHDFSLRI